MRLAIIGQGGQLASALLNVASAENIDAHCYGRDVCDLSSSMETIKTFIENLDTDAIIIAAAYTAVDAAEDDYETAYAVNASAPKAIAQSCAKRNIPLVHISTDYIFQGDVQIPYESSAATDPINAYGKSKLAGEQAVLALHNKSAVLRTSWVFDGTGKNFMTTMLRLGQSRDSLSVVADQFGRPTYARHLAQACLKIITAIHHDAEKYNGIYHVTNSGTPISWADFAIAIFKTAENSLPQTVNVTKISTEEYPTPAKRPKYSVLSLTRYERLFGPLPNWNEGLKQAYVEWLDQ